MSGSTKKKKEIKFNNKMKKKLLWGRVERIEAKWPTNQKLHTAYTEHIEHLSM